MKLIFVVIAALGLSGCGDMYVNSTTIITSKPSRVQEKFPREELFLSCTTIAGLYDYLDNFQSGDVMPNGCGYRQMTAVTSRGQYESYQHGLVNIYQFQNGGIYFTFDTVRPRRVSYY